MPASHTAADSGLVRDALGRVATATQQAADNADTALRIASGAITLTNVTEIPTDQSGRIDLVYTQPTTVHFATPYFMDIVLSIEGWHHITWEGVVVQGIPDPSDVVWASALWRDADSMWHLLAEQSSASGGSGGGSAGNVRIHRHSNNLLGMRDKSPQALDSRGFVIQETYEPFPLTVEHSDVVVDLPNPAGGDPITTYVDTGLYSGGQGVPNGFSFPGAESVFRTPDNSSYVKYMIDGFKIKGNFYRFGYTVKIKGSPLRANTYEEFDSPQAEYLKFPGPGLFVVGAPVQVPGAPAATLTIARSAVVANSYVRLRFNSAPAVSFPTEVVVTGSVEGHVGGSGRRFTLT